MEHLTLNGKQFLATKVQEVPAHLAESCGAEMANEIENFLREWWNSSDAIHVQTSGSTGQPKTISLPKKLVAASADLTVDYFGLHENTTALLCLPCRYIAGKLMLVRAIRSGMALVVRKPGLDVLNQDLENIDFAAMIPGQVHFALEHEKAEKTLRSISQVLIGGGPVDSTMEAALRNFPNRFVHSYGMTETATHVALRDVSAGDAHYTALSGVSFSLDARDCLVIEAAHLSAPVVTNDLVELLDAHRFRWLGRFDHAIISGGLKFLPEVLEQKMAPFLDENFYVTGKPDPKLGETIELVVEGPAWPAGRFDSLCNRLGEVLSAYEIPKSIRFAEQFERTATGKVKRL